MHSILRDSKQGTGKRDGESKVNFMVDDIAEVEHTERAEKLRAEVKKRRADNKKWKKTMADLAENVYAVLMNPTFADRLNLHAIADGVFLILWGHFFDTVKARIRSIRANGNLQGTLFADQLSCLRLHRIEFADIASLENRDLGLFTTQTLQSIGVDYFQAFFFQNPISDGSDEEGNPATGGRAVAAAPVVPANAVAAAVANQVAVAPVGAANAGADGVLENAIAPSVPANAALGGGVNHAAGGRKRRRKRPRGG
jgi:hypothetical protein